MSLTAPSRIAHKVHRPDTARVSQCINESVSVAAGSPGITSNVVTRDDFFPSIPGGFTKFYLLFSSYLFLHLFVCLCLYTSVTSVAVYQSTEGYMGIKQTRVLGPGGESEGIRVPVHTQVSQSPQTSTIMGQGIYDYMFMGKLPFQKPERPQRTRHIEGSRN